MRVDPATVTVTVPPKRIYAGSTRIRAPITALRTYAQ